MKKILFVFILILLLLGGATGYYGYQMVFAPNVDLGEREAAYIYVSTGSTYEDVSEVLFEEGFIRDRNSFEWVARQKQYHRKVKPGKFRITHGMNNNELVNMLRIGEQVPVNIMFRGERTKEEVAGKAAQHLELDSARLADLLYDENYLEQFDKNSENILTVFLPNTYQFLWTTDEERFIQRMVREFNNFWNEERLSKAVAINLTPEEVVILASIVEHETWRNDEKPKVAGVYINRLRINKPLQADPTLIWAIGDFTIQRVLNKDREVESPYNTYKNAGLPPGPLGIPSITAIESVLNYEKHDYLYFVAKPDLSGYSNFSRTYAQHLRYAAEYRREMNNRRIMR